MTTLLLPVVIRFFSENLPHLLPRQVFRFKAFTITSLDLIIRFGAFALHKLRFPDCDLVVSGIENRMLYTML